MSIYLRLTLSSLLLLVTATNTFAQKASYIRTIIVPATGNSTADGTVLLSVLDKLLPPPSSSNRWLIKLEPGIYDVGTQPVIMQEYVDIEGSGIESTTIQGTVAPPPTSLIGGLVEGADNTEIRWLTISCESDLASSSCQGMSLVEANPRLTGVRLQVYGTGTGSHRGIRTFNSHPVLDNVVIEVTARNSTDNYGIVYGGSSRLDITRSEIVARNALNRNVAILLREFLEASQMQDSSATAMGGRFSAGILYVTYENDQIFSLDDVAVTARGASEESVGIGIEGSGSGHQNILIRGGRLSGDTSGIDLLNGNSEVHIVHSEVLGNEMAVGALSVRIGSTWLRGSGSVVAQSAECAGVYDEDFVFFANQCP